MRMCVAMLATMLVAAAGPALARGSGSFAGAGAAMGHSPGGGAPQPLINATQGALHAPGSRDYYPGPYGAFLHWLHGSGSGNADATRDRLATQPHTGPSS